MSKQYSDNLKQTYAPPSGPPPGNNGSRYAPPSGPPPGHSGHPYGSGYAPPPGPPPGHDRTYGSGYAPPPGPPPIQYGPPPDAPPPYTPSDYHGHPDHPQPQHQRPSSYPGRQYGAGTPPQIPYGYPAEPPPRPPAENQTFGPPTPGGNQRFFRYSQCNGRKKGLCIGVNYIGQDSQLAGCINDAVNMKNFLCQLYGYKPDDIVILRDDSHKPMEIPTKENMLRAMQWLVKDARPNDSLFFHYSGHGGLTKNLTGQEESGFDDVIYPVDFKTRGHIIDDQMHDIMVKPLPPGCRLTAIFDSCHSGTALDLPYVYSTKGKIKEPNLMMEAGTDLLSTVTSYARHDFGGVLRGAFDLAKVVSGNSQSQRADRISRETRTSPADVISWGGCKDSQTSADTQEGGQATGAMSYAFITSLQQNRHLSYQQLLITIREILRPKYSQTPQLSSSHPIDTNILFIC